jgi:hypothetical protein
VTAVATAPVAPKEQRHQRYTMNSYMKYVPFRTGWGDVWGPRLWSRGAFEIFLGPAQPSQ